MEGILKSDIFFFITSIAVILLTAGGLFLMMQIYSILKEIREIARHTKQGAEWILEDLDEMRDAIREKGLRLSFLLNFFRGLFGKSSKVRRSIRRTRAEESQDEDGLED